MTKDKNLGNSVNVISKMHTRDIKSIILLQTIKKGQMNLKMWKVTKNRKLDNIISVIFNAIKFRSAP